jgi:hypothetical protein
VAGRQGAKRRLATTRVLSIALLLLACWTSACSVRRMAVEGLADTLAGEGASVFASDDDPELIRDAVPFSLKTMEALLLELPDHRALLLSTCSGFAQYAYAYPATEAELAPASSTKRRRRCARARKLFLRGRDYCLRA